MTLSFLYLLTTFLICLLFVYKDKILRNLRVFLWAQKLPGPLSLPIIGAGHRFLCHQNEIFNRVRGILEESPYPMIKVWLGPKMIVMIREPEYLEKILQSSKLTRKDAMMKVAKPYLGEGLITGHGPSWKAHKKIILPTLSTRAVESYYNIFHKEAEIMVDKLISVYHDTSKSNEVELEDYLHTCAIDIVCETVMGIRLQTQSSINKDFFDAMQMIYYIAIERMAKPWLYSDVLYSLSPLAKVQRKTLKILRTFISNVIDEKRNDYQSDIMRKLIDSKINDREDESEKTFSTTIEQLIDASHRGLLQITDEEMVDEMLTVFLASSDTIAQITCFCLRMLAMHPDYQDAVMEELIRVTDNFEKELDPSMCSELIYMDRCIKETIRLFPIAPFIVRYNKEDFKMGNVTVPGGVTLLLSLYSAHRDPRYWSNPEEFHPDHFLPENVMNRHPYAYLPFSSGLRTCVGKLYAVVSIKIMIAKVLHKFKMVAVPNEPSVKNLPLSSDISVRSIGGNRVILNSRQL